MGVSLTDRPMTYEQYSGLSHRLRLTEREVEVAQHFAEGKTLDQVAADLGFTRSTANTHLHHIYVKLHVHNRIDLLKALVRLRLMECPCCKEE